MMRKLYKSFRFGNKADRNNAEQIRSSSFREHIRNEASPVPANPNSTNRPAVADTNGQAPTAGSTVVKPPEWEKDEELVRGSHCQFRIKYLGSKEVNDSRGMQLCDDAFASLAARYKQYKKGGSGLSSKVQIKLLRSKNSSTTVSSGGQRPAKNALFYISSDGLRVVDENSKSLIVDQTIEKVSFCAPVRVNTKGFAYIARDGASKRWMCHVLLAKDVKGEGERLSHAVGCAFSACLEAKKQRDALCSVEANFHNKNKSVFEKQGTFKEQKTPASNEPRSSKDETKKEFSSKRVFGVVKNAIPEDEEWEEPSQEAAPRNSSAGPVDTPDSAIERKHAPAAMLERMQSMKEFSKLNSKHDLPFSDRSKRRNMSMQIKQSLSVTEGMRTLAAERPGLPRQQSLCIDDSRMLNQPSDIASSSRTEQTNKSMMSQPLNSFDDSFTSQGQTRSTNISNSTSVPLFAANSGNHVQQSSTNKIENTAPTHAEVQPGSSDKVSNQSELSSTNPFFIFVSSSNNTTQQQTTTDLSSPWTTAETNQMNSSYAPTNPFHEQKSSVYSL